MNEEDNLIRRDIVLGMARQIFITLISKSDYATPESCFDIAEVWADAQIAYCEKNADKCRK